MGLLVQAPNNIVLLSWRLWPYLYLYDSELNLVSKHLVEEEGCVISQCGSVAAFQDGIVYFNIDTSNLCYLQMRDAGEAITPVVLGSGRLDDGEKGFVAVTVADAIVATDIGGRGVHIWESDRGHRFIRNRGPGNLSDWICRGNEVIAVSGIFAACAKGQLTEDEIIWSEISIADDLIPWLALPGEQSVFLIVETSGGKMALLDSGSGEQWFLEDVKYPAGALLTGEQLVVLDATISGDVLRSYKLVGDEAVLQQSISPQDD